MTFSRADEASKHGAWTYEEDKLLAKYQEIHGNRWSLVAVNIPGRTGQQCAQRWRHKVNPDIRKEKWTPDEDRLLASLVAEHGNRMPGRTDQQCMGRWRRHLDPNIRKCHWQNHEDELLKQQYEALGPQWSNISKYLQGRTAQQCRARWFQLCPASAAPPVPRSARNQNGRRDRHHDGASIQESARQLVAQMGGTPGGDEADEDGSMQPLNSAEMPEDADERDQNGGTTHRSNSVQMRSSHGLKPEASTYDHMSASAFDNDADARTGVSHARAAAAGAEEDADMAGAAGSTPMKSRRAAARRSDVFRQQLLSPAKGGAGGTRATRSPAKAGRAGALRSPQLMLHPSQLTWEGTRTRTRSAKPRKRFSPILRSNSPSAMDEAECHTPRANRSDSMKLLEAEALEAAAALTEMAGGPRVHPSCSPPSMRATEPPMRGHFGMPQSPSQWVSPQKDTSCCTPAKRPAAVPLWDGPSSSKLSRPGLLEGTPQHTPSHLHMHTPMLQHLAASPGFGASPLPVQDNTVVMTPGSRNMLRSMPLDPVDKMDLPGDFSPGLMSSQGTEPTGMPGSALAPSPNIISAKPSDLRCSSAAPYIMQRGVECVATPAISGGIHGDRRNGSARALQTATLQGPPTRRSLVFSQDAEEDLEASGVAHALVHASAMAHSSPAHLRRDSNGMMQPPSSVMSCHQVAPKAEDKYNDRMHAPDAHRGGEMPLFSQSGGSVHRAFGRVEGIESPPASVRLPGTPEDGCHATHDCIERRISGGSCAARLHDVRKSNSEAHALENDPSAMHAVSGVDNNACDAHRIASTVNARDSPRLGVQTLSPAAAVHCAPGSGAAMGYSVGGIGVSLSPPGSNGAAHHSGESRGKLSPEAAMRCDSESMLPGVEHSPCPRQPQADNRMNADCSGHFNINLNVKAVSNNSSTGKSSGVSSIDGLERIVPNHDSSAADAVKVLRAGGDREQTNGGGDMSGDNGRQTEDDGSFSIRQKLHSLVDDVFAFVV